MYDMDEVVLHIADDEGRPAVVRGARTHLGTTDDGLRTAIVRVVERPVAILADPDVWDPADGDPTDADLRHEDLFRHVGADEAAAFFDIAEADRAAFDRDYHDRWVAPFAPATLPPDGDASVRPTVPDAEGSVFDDLLAADDDQDDEATPT